MRTLLTIASAVAVCAAAFGGDLALQPIPATAAFSGKYHGSLRPENNDTPDRSIDHVYYTKGIHALRHEIVTDQAALDVSDHSPVLVEFELVCGEP